MGRILGLLLFIFCSPAFAATPSGVPQVNFGYGSNSALAAKSVPYTSLTNTFALVAEAATGTNTGYYKFVKIGSIASSGTQYQVTTGKTLYCSGYFSASGSAVNYGFGYGTAAVGSDATITPPTGAKQMFGNATGTTNYGGVANVMFWFPIPVQFPALSFPYLYGSSIATNFTCVLICEEQ